MWGARLGASGGAQKPHGTSLCLKRPQRNQHNHAHLHVVMLTHTQQLQDKRILEVSSVFMPLIFTALTPDIQSIKLICRNLLFFFIKGKLANHLVPWITFPFFCFFLRFKNTTDCCYSDQSMIRNIIYNTPFGCVRRNVFPFCPSNSPEHLLIRDVKNKSLFCLQNSQ